VVTSNGIEPVTVKLAPKLKFRDGRVRKIDLKVKEIKAPPVLKGLIWSTVSLEKTLGVFQSEMVKEVNEFLHDKCPSRHGS